ncbi:hypothetical protein G5I_00532 [Acromyrmex echinatior]|uniref:Uncharacterized protein n=1 Tax=Acromyrmex echinatior TaxID=103372 RepID=F4W541_ACREC|nr:hypothetical protein G5I_00532 [Acromyrmex echinatior]
MGRWDRLTQTRKRLALEAECASFRYRREWAGYRGGYLHLEELQNLSNSTLHNTAGRTQAVNISAVQRMVGGKKEDSEQKKQSAGWKLENRSGAARPLSFAKLRTENSRLTGSPYLDVQLIQSLLYVIVFGSGQLEKLFPAGRQIRTKAEARPAGFRRDIVSDGGAITRGGSEWVGIRTYVETSSSSSSCTCGYRSNPEGVATTAAPLCGGLLIGVALRLPPPSSLSNLPAFLRVPPPLPLPPRRSGPALRVTPPPVTPFRNKALHPPSLPPPAPP